MPKCTNKKLSFGRVGRREIEANFEGGAISTDGGAMLLSRIDHFVGVSRAVAGALVERRDSSRVTHCLEDMIRQRLFALAQGHEDLNDHDKLRSDPLFQTAIGTVEELASSPTLCRLERQVTRKEILALNAALVTQFIKSHDDAPKCLILDFDASDIPLHGNQEGRQFHGYYDHHCYLPLYVYCGDEILASVLRRSQIDGARHAAAIMKLLVQKLRQAWPDVQIILRADSGFCRQLLINWCERNGVDYIIGVARNKRLQAAVTHWEDALRQQYRQTSQKQRAIHEFRYGAKTWKKERRVITRLEYGHQGVNPRFIVTNLKECPIHLYDEVYCQRGEAENRIKETQLDLFGTRTSCQRFLPNWFRIMLSAFAYTLMQRLKKLALANTELARATTATIRSRLLKMGAIVIRNTRRIRILYASHHPLRGVFAHAIQALAP